ncbi:hypothetical protein K502DRAFT_71078 [Neoconidiobolus thromboides FSU 785]|nr:hypothetical protein K502DRAFT_71078 [Neoconidiobolus thromboides FSU 785]
MTTSTKSTEKIDISADQSTPKNTIITPPGDNTPTSPTSPTSPLSKSSFTNDSLNSRLKLPTQIPIGNNQEKNFQSLSNISNSFNPLSNNPKVTRAASISVVPQSNFDYYNGFSSSLGTSPNTRLNRPDPLSSSLGGWPNKDIWPNDYTSPVDQARSPSFNKAPESPLGRSYINNFQDSMLSPRRSSYNPSDTPISAYGRTRNVATAEFPGRSRNPMNALKDEKFNMDRLSSSMSPMFGAPIDRSPLYRDYVGSPQLSGSLNQEYENEPPFALNPNEYYRVSLARRMSLTPNFGPYNPYDDLNAQMETL